MLNELFGALLRRMRKEAGLSQEKLAFHADLDRTYISLLEGGKRSPSLETLFLLSRGLNMPADQFLRIVGEEILKNERQATDQ